MTQDFEVVGGKLVGCAARFGRIAAGTDGRGRRLKPATIVYGAFRRTLLESRNVELCIGQHGGRVACDTESGSLFLEERRDGLYFTAWPLQILAGWQAWECVSSGRYRQVSFCGLPTKITAGKIDVVREYSLADIAIVRRGSQEKTFVKAISESELRRDRAAKVAVRREPAAAGSARWLVTDLGWQSYHPTKNFFF